MSNKNKFTLTVREVVIFGMLGAAMYVSKLALEFLPNVHVLGVFTIALTVVYRQKALFPIYVFILIMGMVNGFATWWLPHLYLWTVLWGAVMLLPKNLSSRWRPWVYMLVCAAHGLFYGTLYAPAQALLFGLNFKAMIAWIIAGFPWDLIHGVSNFFMGLLIIPIIKALEYAEGLMSKRFGIRE